jgi:hypothetical protein
MKGKLKLLTEIDQIVRQEIDLQGPGVAIAVVKDGKPVHIEGYGIANLEAYYASEDDDFEVHFADEHAGLFNTLIGHLPLLSAFKANRKQS